MSADGKQDFGYEFSLTAPEWISNNAIIGFGGGFILATSALFVTTSGAFARRAILVDSIIALVMSTLIYLAFDRLLTLSLPTGPLERLL